MINLDKTTLIIPLKIEHRDRYRNTEVVLNFLNRHFKTNVFIFEISSTGKSRIDFIDKLENLKIKHWVQTEEKAFHRTKYLNIMLDDVETPVVANYDIDVILDPNNFLECQNLILQKKADVIYPYELGNGQVQVLENFDYNGFKESGFELNFINDSGQTRIHPSECGHCIFFDTQIYKNFGGENEGFISYGPEDKERMNRFKNLGKKVEWRGGQFVYHFEHFRGDDSWVTNPFFEHNWSVFNHLSKMDSNNLHHYYKSNLDYYSKYKTIGKNDNEKN